ncbi:MAG: hypothetical protein M1827_007265 [Pycnora praestabilis]|nr:MAG: hypothetical protein M1827_007265 [Pycnora praestabilis]
MDAAIEAGLGSVEYQLDYEPLIQFLPLRSAIHYAYDLWTHVTRKFPHYGQDELEVVIISVDYNTAFVALSVILTELGEVNIETDGKFQKPSKTQVQQDYNSLRENLQQLLGTILLQEDSQDNRGFGWKPIRSDIKAVVLSGDASLRGFDSIRNILREVLSDLDGGEKLWLNDNINPSWVLAIGAAKRARDMQDDPLSFQPQVQWIEHDHNELR